MTQVKYKIKKGDTVEVVTGKEKGKRGEVSKVFLAEGKVLINGVNVVTRFLKQTAQNPNGPITKNLPLQISNIALVDPTTDRPGKVGVRFNASGKKERFFKKSGSAVL